MKYLRVSCISILCLGGSISSNAMETATNLVTKISSLLVGTAAVNKTTKICRSNSTDEKTGEKKYIETYSFDQKEGLIRVTDNLAHQFELFKGNYPPFTLRVWRNKLNVVTIAASLTKEMAALKDESEKIEPTDFRSIYNEYDLVWVPWVHNAIITDENKSLLQVSKQGRFRGGNRLDICLISPALSYELTIPHDASLEIELSEGNIDFVDNNVATDFSIEALNVVHKGSSDQFNSYLGRQKNCWVYRGSTSIADPGTVLKTKQGTVAIEHVSLTHPK